VNGVPVVYSMGNFWFNSKTLDSCMIELEMKDGELAGLKFVPCLQSGCTVRKLDGADADRLLDYMRSISPNVNIDDEGYVTPK
jgi:poly-gamma-glutamate synthesis protein (capsule biosynthesis protein)